MAKVRAESDAKRARTGDRRRSCIAARADIVSEQAGRGWVECSVPRGATNLSKAEAWRITMAEARTPVERPLSPHLQIYRWPLPMAMSIAHRISGVGLYFGMLLVAWWLIAAASGPNAYANVAAFMGSFIGRLVLFGYTWALLHHMLGGIRHFVWDTGHGFSVAEREWLSLATLVGSISLTVVLWIVGYLLMGGTL
jgi:succinate dehydrogenase / fumarate reductase, cytochrome b subunit